MQLKKYQQKALDALDAWLKELNNAYYTSEDQRNYPKHAWKALKRTEHLPLNRHRIPYVSRTGESTETRPGAPIPHACLKVPTGGGKTLLGAAAVERVLANYGQQTGLLLWVVPTRAIYEQTKATLWNRQHPYRQWLARACGGRVKVMEKDDPLTRLDVENHLCVMLLMFPSANRQKSKDFLRMYRNSGIYPGFFPEDDRHPLAQGEFRNRYPHLDFEPDRDGLPGIIKHSLFNVFKLCRPIVILDEAHKAYGRNLTKASEEYAKSISRLEPRIVIELSATPHDHISNVLVDIQGTALHAEEMIKLPIQVETRGESHDWQDTLNLAHQRLEDLDRHANTLEASNGRYIRPIAVVRVERTGKNQRDGIKIHAEDARDHLISIGVSPEAIRIKSSETDELGREDLIGENPRSQVRWIITKDALKEGWDCPFAYILVLLDNTRAKTAITQMVGRVLRMPHVQSTDTDELNRCYVICHNAEVLATVEHVRAGLVNEGMGDLSGFVDPVGVPSNTKKIRILRREKFRGEKIFLPKVLHRDRNDQWRDLDYDRDILAEIDWDKLKIEDMQGINIAPPAGGMAHIGITGVPQKIHNQMLDVDDRIDITYFARQMGSVIPNPWRAAHLARQAIDDLLNNTDIDERAINASRAAYAEQFRANLYSQIDKQAKEIFIGKLSRGEIRFDLEADEGNYKLAQSYCGFFAPTMPAKKSLYEPTLWDDFNELEKEFAFSLDGRKAISWWHRIAERQRGSYFIRGWRRDRIFPDFVAIAKPCGVGNSYKIQLLIYETKGAHLEGNSDTKYKQKLLCILQSAFNGDLTPMGKMTLQDGDPKGIFRMVFQDKIHQALAGTLAEK